MSSLLSCNLCTNQPRWRPAMAMIQQLSWHSSDTIIDQAAVRQRQLWCTQSSSRCQSRGRRYRVVSTCMAHPKHVSPARQQPCQPQQRSAREGTQVPLRLAAACWGVSVFLAATLAMGQAPAQAAGGSQAQRSPEAYSEDAFNNIPGQLGSTGTDDVREPSLGLLLKGDKGGQVTNCARKCMPACIRGGQGAPGLGPISLRREAVVFKDGFRSRHYCLSECTQVCYASINGPLAAKAAPADARPQ